MNNEKDIIVQVEELKALFPKEPVPIVEKTEVTQKTHDSQKDGEAIDPVLKKETDLVEQTLAAKNEWIKITIWRGRVVHINRSLIPLRSALFFWCASGSLCSPFFFLMLVNRGLALSDFSSIFSVIFLLQFLVSYICGIVVDKLGNAIPILLFLMLSTVFVVIGLVLSPSVKNNSCVELDVNETCFNVFNYTSDFKYCKQICFINKTDSPPVPTVNVNTFSSNISTESSNVFRKSGKRKNAFYANETAFSCNKICSCIDSSVHSCSNKSTTVIKILYSALILSFFPLWSTTYRFLDFAALTAAKKYHSDFGRERFFGNFGIVIATLTVNFIFRIDKSGTKSYYDNVYWFAVFMYILSIISACNLKNVRLPPGIELSKKTLKLFTDVEILSVFLVAFGAGVAFTFNNFFHLFFLNSLGASKTVIGLHMITISFYGLPMYLTSKYWINKLGKKKIMVIGLLSYVINATCYSFLFYPWIALIIEITNAFAFHLFWVSIVILSREVAPAGLAATVNAIVGTIHFGIGRSFSVSVGGYLFSNFGGRAAHGILAVFCLIIATMYSVLLYLRQFLQKKSGEKRNKEEMESMNEKEGLSTMIVLSE